MIFPEETYTLNGKTILLRSAIDEDAQMLIDYLKTVSGETRFLLRDPDEINIPLERERAFIQKRNAAPEELMLLAFVDGEYAGNCSFEGLVGRRRSAHRADVAIALYQKYTGFGLGRLMLERLLRLVREKGYEQAELTVNAENARAMRLYERLGFRAVGRFPRASKYADGSYADEIFMVLDLR